MSDADITEIADPGTVATAQIAEHLKFLAYEMEAQGEAWFYANDPRYRPTLFAAADVARALGDVDRLASAAIRLAANAGFAFGVSIGGFLADHSLFWLFAGDALTTALYGCIALAWLPHGLRRLTASTPWSAAFASLRRDRTFHALWIAGFCGALIFSQFGSTYSLFVLEKKLTLDLLGWHLPPTAIYGLLLGWNGALVVLAELPLTSATLRFDSRRVMALGHALTGLGFALNAVSSTIFMLWLGMTIFTIGEMISSPTANAYLARIAPEQMRGRYMGALALAWNAAGIVGPQLGLRLFALDPLLLWLGYGLLGLVGAWAILRTGRTADAP